MSSSIQNTHSLPPALDLLATEDMVFVSAEPNSATGKSIEVLAEVASGYLDHTAAHPAGEASSAAGPAAPAVQSKALHTVSRSTGRAGKRFFCKKPGCGKSFDRAAKLTIHMRVHSGERPYKCTWEGCGKRFAQPGNLTVHMRVHTGERPYECTWENCGMRFVTSGPLGVHMRSHTGERPYECTWENCGKRFTTAGNLKVHRRSHTGERSYKCTWEGCGLGCTTLRSLQAHMRVHTGEKPHACACGKRFTRPENLKKHKRKAHQGDGG